MALRQSVVRPNLPSYLLTSAGFDVVWGAGPSFVSMTLELALPLSHLQQHHNLPLNPVRMPKCSHVACVCRSRQPQDGVQPPLAGCAQSASA